MRAHGSISEQYQQNSSSSLFAGAHRSGGMRPAPAPENPTFSLFPPGSSGHNSMETDDVGGSRFYAWERDRFAPYPLMPLVDFTAIAQHIRACICTKETIRAMAWRRQVIS
nr:unnamed protein product [Digitaria exilis]